MDEEELITLARRAREKAYAPYSRFKVGAALLGASGKIYTGCNIENASYGATICAERVAAAQAVADGEREFKALAVVSDAAAPSAPCGICRQFLVEFSPDLPVILANRHGEIKRTSLRELLPGAFTRLDLEPESGAGTDRHRAQERLRQEKNGK